MYEMKESGIKWIGQIPKHWEVRKMKYCFISHVSGSWGQEQLFNDNDIVCIRVADFAFNKMSLVAKSIDNYTKRNYSINTIRKLFLHKNDILIEKSGGGDNTPVGRSIIIDIDFVAVYSNFIERLRVISSANPKYMQYILFSFYKSNCIFNYIKQTTGIQNLDISMMFNIEKILFPPLTEQKKIADFLDKKVSEIENLIDDTKKLIEKYREYKQSIITETVTKGLNSNVEMKESGIEWIGQIPKHWKIKLVKELFYNVNNKNIGVKEKNLLSLSYGKIIPKDIYKNDGLVPANFNNYNIIKYDDIVLRLTDLQNDKKSLRVGHARENGIITSAYITLRPVSNYSTRYYYFLLHFYDICKYFYGVGSGVRQSLSFEEVKKILILFPPLNEQEEIAKYLDDKCSQIDNIIEEKQLLLEKLEAYKKSLIYEYVTGKKQVENE